MTLTREQKIKRAVKRLNNKANRELPLIASLIQTTEAEQEKRYDEIDASHVEYVAKLDASEAEMQERGNALRAKAIDLYNSEEIRRLDDYYDRVLKNLSFAYFADYWRKALNRRAEVCHD
jgi:hypothetical protein